MLLLFCLLEQLKQAEHERKDECLCGKEGQSSKDGSRIVGGSFSNIDDYPWQVKIMKWEISHFCGGTVISRFVLEVENISQNCLQEAHSYCCPLFL